MKCLDEAVMEDPRNPGSYKNQSYKSIPFGLTLERRGDKQVLVPTSKGPEKPANEGEANKAKVRFNTKFIEPIPSIETIPEDIPSL